MRTSLLITAYLFAIVAANLSIAAWGPGMAIVNAFVFIALDLTARDALHDAWRGRGLAWKMGCLIAAGSLLSYLLNAGAGRIALASFVAFAVSAMLDSIVYWRLEHRSQLVKMNGSNIVGAATDSLLFPTLAFGVFLPWVVLGQFAAKVLGGYLWSLVLSRRAEQVTE